MRPPPSPPRPELYRRPAGRFGWLEDRLLQERWLADLGPNAPAVLVLLALAADRRGASYYSRARMASLLSMDLDQVDHSLKRLQALNLLAFRPWRPTSRDGVWQLLPLPVPNPPKQPTQRSSTQNEPTSIANILKSIGLST